MRRGRRERSIVVSDLAGPAGLIYGFGGPDAHYNGSWILDPRSGQPLSSRIYDAGQSIPFYGKDPAMAPNRTSVAAGILIPIVGRMMSLLIRSPKIKLGRGRSIRFW